MKKQIFDLLDHDPADIDEYLIEPVYDIDPEKIKGKIHTCLNERENSLYSIRKRRRFPLLLAAAVAVVLLIGGGIVACASLYVSPEDEMQRKLTEDFEARVDEIDMYERDRVMQMYDIVGEDITDISGAGLTYIIGIKFLASLEEMQKVCDIINTYTDNKYKGYTGYLPYDVYEYPEFDDYLYYFNYVSDVCEIYNTKEITVEEKMRILNFLHNTFTFDLSNRYFKNFGDVNDHYFEVKYADERAVWAKAYNDTFSILKESKFEEKYGFDYYVGGRTHKIIDTPTESNTESSDDGSEPYASN